MRQRLRGARPNYARAVWNTVIVLLAVLSIAAVRVPEAFPVGTDGTRSADTAAPAAIPGQPNGIPEDVNGEGWRFKQGNICFEDWTGGAWSEAIQYQAAQYSRSADVNGYYRIRTNSGSGCDAAGFDESTKVTFVLNHAESCYEAGGIGQAWVWTEGGLFMPNYLVTRAIVHVFPNCPGWYPTDPDLLRQQKRMVAGHEAGHAFGFAHQEFPVCATTAPQSWKCRPDTIMAADARYQWWLSEWDLWRLERIHPW